MRWDKGRVADYHNITRAAVSDINYDLSRGNCSEYCSIVGHNVAINNHYMNIVSALKKAERATIPLIPHNALKPFWNDHLDDLKHKSILWHDIWCNSANPSRV